MKVYLLLAVLTISSISSLQLRNPEDDKKKNINDKGKKELKNVKSSDNLKPSGKDSLSIKAYKSPGKIPKTTQNDNITIGGMKKAKDVHLDPKNLPVTRGTLPEESGLWAKEILKEKKKNHLDPKILNKDYGTGPNDSILYANKLKAEKEEENGNDGQGDFSNAKDSLLIKKQQQNNMKKQS